MMSSSLRRRLCGSTIVSLVVVIALLVPPAVSRTDKERKGDDDRDAHQVIKVAASCTRKCHDMCAALPKSEDPFCDRSCLISFAQNAAPAPKPGAEGVQAVALMVSGDRAAFWGCGFFGAQDTLHDDENRHCFKECLIHGSIDFIFSDAQSLYENCTLLSMAEQLPQGQHSINGAITAQGRRFPDNNTGFSFVGCRIEGSGWILLWRAWQAYSRVIFSYTFMPAIVATEEWDNWGNPDRNSTVFYGEFECTGDGANAGGRVPYARKLNKSEAQPFLTTAFIDGFEWLSPFNDSAAVNLFVKIQ